MRPKWQGLINSLRYRIEEQGKIKLVELARKDYPHFGALSEVRREMSGCSGVVVVGLGELEIHDAIWRAGTPEETSIENNIWPTPWVNIEAGMAVGLDLPMLLLAQPQIKTGIFDEDSDGHLIYRLDVEADFSSPRLESTLEDWYAAVRKRACG